MKKRDYAALALTLCLGTPAATLADTVTIGASRDNTLCEDAVGSLSNGAGQYMFAGVTDEPTRRRALVYFDIAGSVPAGATINAVSLTLNMSRTQAGPRRVDLHPVTVSWGEGTSDASQQEGKCAPSTPGDATWIHSTFDTMRWTSAGGDFAGAASASLSVDQPGSYTWTSTPQLVSDVQSWLDDPTRNFGWILIADESAQPTAKRFDTHEHADPTRRPALLVDYTTGGGGGATLYESTTRSNITDPGNAVATPGVNPYPHTPAIAPLLYYQMDDGAGNPPLIRLKKLGTDIEIYF